MPARQKKAATRLMAAYMGLRAATTPMAAATSGMAKTKKMTCSAVTFIARTSRARPPRRAAPG